MTLKLIPGLTGVFACLLVSNVLYANDAGQFSAMLDDKAYQVAVRCSSIDRPYFQFLSDHNDYQDSNGNGLMISGMQDDTG